MKKYPIEVTEKRTVKRITVSQSVTDFLDAFNVERGLIFTVKLLFVKPGKLIRFYLQDGRFKVVNAFRLLIITTALSLILLSFTNSFDLFYSAQGDSAEQTKEMESFMNTIFTEWYNLMLWISIPCYALSSFWLLRKYEAFNYAEHLVIQSFFISISNMLIVLCLPFGYFIGFRTAFLISFFVGIGYYIFVFYDIYRQKRFWFFFRALLAFGLGNFFYIMLLGVGLAIAMIQMMG